MPSVNPEYLVAVFLIAARIGAGFVAMPVFDLGSVSVRIRIFLAILMSHSLTVLLPAGELDPHIFQPLGMMAAVIIEALTGILFGFAMHLIFYAVQYAGEVMGFQIGLAMAHVFNPIDGSQSNPIGNILSYVVRMMFILLEGHHHVIRAVVISFDVVPLAEIGRAHV